MTITQVFLLLVCAFVLVLLLSILFKRYHRDCRKKNKTL